MRKRLESLPVAEAYLHADFAENIGVPLANRQTSDQFHGSQRKTLSVFGAYIVQPQQKNEKSRKLAVVLVSDVIEKSALYANKCIEKTLPFIHKLGKLQVLRCCFDSGNHFRSAQSAHLLLHDIPLRHRQRTVCHYLVEKHGKGPDDSEIFSRLRAWVQEYLRQDGVVIDEAQTLVQVFQAAADREYKANPLGVKFHCEVFDPGERPQEKQEISFEDHITRSYCWESIPGKKSVSFAIGSFQILRTSLGSPIVLLLQKLKVEIGEKVIGPIAAGASQR